MAKRSQKEVNEFLSQFFSNPRVEGEKESKLLYTRSVASGQFQRRPLEDAKGLRQIPYEEVARDMELNRPKSTLNTKSQIQMEFTHKRLVPHEQFILSDKEIWHDDRRTKAKYPGKKETETQGSYQRQPFVKSEFEYPNLFEHHFSFGSGMRKLQGNTQYKQEFQTPEQEGALSKPCKDLNPRNQQVIPKTNTGQTQYQKEYER